MTRFAPLLLLLSLGLSSPAFAHYETGRSGVGWTFDPAIMAPLALVLLLYLIGVARVWRRAGFGHGVRRWNTLGFAAGWLALAGALASPLHQLGERSLAAHMVEHELLMAVAAPLLVLASPATALLWSLPKASRVALGRLARGPIAAVWRRMTRPLAATLLHGVAIWAWHVPALFEAAVAHESVHWLQHASFFGTALIFWWALIRAGARERAHGPAVGHLFATSMHTGLLGALMVVSPSLWYLHSASAHIPLGLSPLEDQQLAGLIMWAPGGLIYAAAALVFAGLWIAESSRERGGFVHALSTQ